MSQCLVERRFRDGLIALIPKLRAYAISLTGRTAEADDLLQDALVRAWRFREGFEPDTNLKAWAFRILRNEFLSRLAAGRATIQDVDGKFAAALAFAPEQEWRLAYSEVLEALDQLSPITRDALLLVTASGFTYEEAAELCGCAVGTLKSRVNRARQQLMALVSVDPRSVVDVPRHGASRAA